MRAELSLFVLATENRERILNSISRTLKIPPETMERIKIQHLTGHFGYPIEFLKLKLNEKETERLINLIFDELPDQDKKRLFLNIDDFVDDKGNLYLRLNKQKICIGQIHLSDQDPVRIVVKGGKKKIRELIREGGYELL
ncbi:hypothetical protein DRN86_05495 [Candidatus Geothermarchaeota archaeon]|nr:MAG: hypothetical protein DRN86_05495 [Candidatus Geothermarchaeota archaeon]